VIAFFDPAVKRKVAGARREGPRG